MTPNAVYVVSARDYDTIDPWLDYLYTESLSEACKELRRVAYSMRRGICSILVTPDSRDSVVWREIFQLRVAKGGS